MRFIASRAVAPVGPPMIRFVSSKKGKQGAGVSERISEAYRRKALEQIFTKARTHSVWLPEPVSDEILHQTYDLMKWGPTSANSSPGRIVFVKSKEVKEKLLACMAEGNVEKTKVRL